MALGGQAGTSRRIENNLGFPAGISGSELTSRAITQARKFGTRSATPYRAEALEPLGDRRIAHLPDDRQIVARAVVLATGADYRRLDVPCRPPARHRANCSARLGPCRAGRRGPSTVTQDEDQLVPITPQPLLARLQRPDERVTGGVMVSGGMVAGTVVAAADVPALRAPA